MRLSSNVQTDRNVQCAWGLKALKQHNPNKLFQREPLTPSIPAFIVIDSFAYYARSVQYYGLVCTYIPSTHINTIKWIGKVYFTYIIMILKYWRRNENK